MKESKLCHSFRVPSVYGKYFSIVVLPKVGTPYFTSSAIMKFYFYLYFAAITASILSRAEGGACGCKVTMMIVYDKQ
jgi:hypothetical protein